LFLWNYEDGSDFCYYDELDEYNVIVTAALVRAKRNVFVSGVEHLLVLATPVLVVVLAVGWQGEPIDGELNLLPVQMSVASDNVNMVRIVGTDCGRIFMGGNDGCLYELVYQARDGWFTKRCRKLNHSSSSLTSLVPSFLRFGTPVPVVDMVVDDRRHVLYTLDEHSTVAVYDLGTDGAALRRAAHRADIRASAARLCPREPSLWDQNAFALTSLHVVEEPGPVHLVAVSSTGIRLYFTTFTELRASDLQNSAALADWRPTGCVLAHVRLPPQLAEQNGASAAAAAASANGAFGAPFSEFASDDDDDDDDGGDEGNNNNDAGQSASKHDVHTAYCSRGVFVMANQALSTASDRDVIVGVAHTDHIAPHQRLEHRRPRASDGRRRGCFCESCSAVEIDGRAWAIAEVPLPHSVANSRALWNRSTPYNELASQHALPPRRLLCLTNMELHVLVKLRPIDELYALLSAPGAIDTDALVQFFAQYGAVQSRAMCLALACAPSSASTAIVYDVARSMASSAFGGASASASAAASAAAAAASSDFSANSMWQSLSSGARSDQRRQRQRAAAAASSSSSASAIRDAPPTAVPSVVRESAIDAFFQPAAAHHPQQQQQQHAQYDGAPSTPQPSSDGALGYAITTPEVMYSAKHDGLVLYISRLLRPVWTQSVFVASGSGVCTHFEPSALEYVEATLLSLLGFLNEHPEFTAAANSRKRLYPDAGGSLGGGPGGGHAFGNVQKRLLNFTRTAHTPGSGYNEPMRAGDDATFSERKSLWHLYLLVVRAAEALAFVLTLARDHSINDIVAHYMASAAGTGGGGAADSAACRALLSRITFKDFVASADGVNLTKWLVAALIEFYTRDGRPIEDISELLRRRCPSFFGEQDHLRFRAYELLSLARQQPAQRDDYLLQSLKLFMRIAAHVNLGEICAEYASSRYYYGVVMLSLACAHSADRQQRALAFYKSGADASDEQGRVAYDARMRCYAPIVAAFDALLAAGENRAAPQSPLRKLASAEIQRLKSEMIAAAMASTDELFHIALYEWFLRNGLADELLVVRAQFLETFLQHTAAEHPERYDMLWRHYAHHRRYGQAARVLAKLAVRQDPPITLAERIDYLSKAILNAKCSTSTSDNASLSSIDGGDERPSSSSPSSSSSSSSSASSPSSSSVGKRASVYDDATSSAANRRDGELLLELQEKLEVARVQLQILTTLERNRAPQLDQVIRILSDRLGGGDGDASPSMPSTSWELSRRYARALRLSAAASQLLNEQQFFDHQLVRADVLAELERRQTSMRTALDDLNRTLFTVTDLYTGFAQTYRLWEACLAILECSKHSGVDVARKVWMHMFNDEREAHRNNLAAQRDAMAKRVRLVGRQYNWSSTAFPVDKLCECLERFSYACAQVAAAERSHASVTGADWVVATMRDADIVVPFQNLFDVYNRFFESSLPLHLSAVEGYVATADTSLHLIKCLYELLERWAEFVSTDAASAYELRQFELKHLPDAINAYIASLHTSASNDARDYARRFQNLLQLPVFSRQLRNHPRRQQQRQRHNVSSFF
jgi:nuclear pore complex protein Nup155